MSCKACLSKQQEPREAGLSEGSLVAFILLMFLDYAMLKKRKVTLTSASQNLFKHIYDVQYLTYIILKSTLDTFSALFTLDTLPFYYISNPHPVVTDSCILYLTQRNLSS